MSFMTNFEQFGDNIFDRPKVGKSLGLVDYNFPKIDLENLFRKEVKQESFWQKLKSIFS